MAQIRYTTERFCQFNSCKKLNRISWNFVVDKGILCTCAYRKILFDIFLREQLKLWPKRTILCNLCETVLPWMTEELFNQISFDSECPNVTQMWQLLINYVYPFITDIWLWCCVLANHYCMAIHYVQHCRAMLECGVWELAHSFFFFQKWGGVKLFQHKSFGLFLN